MKSSIRRFVTAFSVLLCNACFVVASESSDCTLDPRQEEKRVLLSNGVTARAAWRACTSLGITIDFSPVNVGDPNVALDRAASLVEEFEAVTNESVCPFGVSLSTSFKSRASHDIPYVFDENVPISNVDVRGWDGASVSAHRENAVGVLRVRYWANP